MAEKKRASDGQLEQPVTRRAKTDEAVLSLLDVPSYIFHLLLPNLKSLFVLSQVCRSLNNLLKSQEFMVPYCTRLGYHEVDHSRSNCYNHLLDVRAVRHIIRQKILPYLEEKEDGLLHEEIHDLEERFAFRFPLEMYELLRQCGGGKTGDDEDHTVVVLFTYMRLRSEWEREEEDFDETSPVFYRPAIGYCGEYAEFRVGCSDEKPRERGKIWKYTAPHPSWTDLGDFYSLFDYIHIQLVTELERKKNGDEACWKLEDPLIKQWAKKYNMKWADSDESDGNAESDSEDE